jgi:glycosyltransferase involved in cell wall biosynthesis
MKVWLPSVRSQSGSDVFVERLGQLLLRAGCEVQTTWFSLRHEIFPWSLKGVRPPAGTDVIHANSWNAFAFARPDLPLVVTVHHCVRHTGYPAWKKFSQSLYHDHWIGNFEARSFARADAILAGTASAAKEVALEFALQDRIGTIEYWIDLHKYRPAEPREVGKRVLWVGNVSLRKGADLLPAFRRHLDSSIELNIVAGRRGEGEGLEQLGPNVKVWPRLSEAELIRLYQLCDVTVSLSRHEGFGYTALEAMACGRPVVAFDVTGLKDVVHHDVTGLLCPVDDVQAVADACEHLLAEPATCQRMGELARIRAVEAFAPERAARQYLETYRRLVDSRK